jgi:glucose-6-phosphate 1-dehydrogenase
VLEKPFGHDAVSAAALNRHLARTWSEPSLYRIDRYLGKEVIDNLLVMRFANRLLTPIWNRDNIANVQIIHKEPFGAISDYFDAHGIIRDVLQNHLLQILAVLAMDRPVSLDPEDIRDAKLKVLRQVDRVDVEHKVVAGQYVAHEGKLGYKDNPNVAADSRAPHVRHARAEHSERTLGRRAVHIEGGQGSEREAERDSHPASADAGGHLRRSRETRGPDRPGGG